MSTPRYIVIKATTQSEGDLHLSDGASWNTSKALISLIRVVTSSTDWDLYILQNDNGYAANDANIPMMQIVEAGNGNINVRLDLPFEDEDDSGEVHLYYLDNSGANTADIYVIGYALDEGATSEVLAVHDAKLGGFGSIVSAILVDTALMDKWLKNKIVFTGTSMTLYDDDGTTPLLTWTLSEGSTSVSGPYNRAKAT